MAADLEGLPTDAPDAPVAPNAPPYLRHARPAFDDRFAHVRWFLRQHPWDLYALVDAARDDQVLPFLMESQEPFESLYEGRQGEIAGDVAPYLLRVAPDSAVLGELVERAWGQSWGVFLTSDVDARELRRHLRQFLRVRDEDGKVLLFRYYDPRVLRAYLPTCTPAETQHFFGPVDAFVVEGRGGASALHFSATPEGPRTFAEAIPEPVP